MGEKYLLVDSGDQKKLEQFGDYLLVRPCAQALWKPACEPPQWKEAAAHFSRDGGNAWIRKTSLPPHWVTEIQGIRFKVSPTDFGHLGVFPEHSQFFPTIQHILGSQKRALNVLNLFAYSGGATLAAAKAGAKVCHVDASKGMVAWARENAALNQLSSAPIRWIVDDVFKFLTREMKRNVRYDGIILDPPSFGRGVKGEVFKIEKDIHTLLQLCVQLLSNDPLFFIFTTHTPAMTPLVMRHLLEEKMAHLGGKIHVGEMLLTSSRALPIPSGSFAKWEC